MKSEWQERMRSGNKREFSFREVEVSAESVELQRQLMESVETAIRNLYQGVEDQLKAIGIDKFDRIPDGLVLKEWFEMRDGKFILCAKLAWSNESTMLESGWRV